MPCPQNPDSGGSQALAVIGLECKAALRSLRFAAAAFEIIFVFRRPSKNANIRDRIGSHVCVRMVRRREELVFYSHFRTHVVRISASYANNDRFWPRARDSPLLFLSVLYEFILCCTMYYNSASLLCLHCMCKSDALRQRSRRVFVLRALCRV